MTQKMKYRLTLALLFMSFGYAADGYQTAAYVFSMFAVLAAVWAHQWKDICAQGSRILLYGSFAAGMTWATGLTARMPAVWFVCFCSCASCLIFEKNSLDVIRNTVFCMAAVMAVLCMMTVFVPYTVYGQQDTFLLVAAAFLPILLTYLHKVILLKMKKSKVRMATRPQLY